MTNIESNDLEELARVCFPYAARRTEEMKANGNRFVYYTTAEVAMHILRNQQIWLRNALLMNDFSEISHGFACLNAAYNGPSGTVLKAALASCFPDLPREVEDMFNALLPNVRGDTYLTCFSEHCLDEDRRGRLSMWRAYGGATGVAVVINGAVMHGDSTALGALSSPVYYADSEAFAKDFMEVASGIRAATPLLKRVGKDAVRSTVFQMLRFAALCTKHPGFQEELEWRVIASPTIYSTPRLSTSIEVIQGVPQQVVKIKLESAPDEGLVGLGLRELLDRIIIGPCEFPQMTAAAFYKVLVDLGFDDAQDRVVVADIPLRHRTQRR